MSELTIYKASAGSGKTFTLAREYLKLMFKSNGGFSHILAVTFTKKATAEMAERILNELYLLASGKPSANLQELQEDNNKTEEVIRQQALHYLNFILHNYNRFNISTIDSFFQQILKAFTREVGLNAGFNVEVNQKSVIEESVAIMFEKLHEKPRLQGWLSQFAKDKLDEGKNWDVQKELVDFAQKALSDAFYGLSKEQLEQLADFEGFVKYKNLLTQELKKFRDLIVASAQSALEQIGLHGLTIADFSYNSKGVMGYVEKISKLKYYEINSGCFPTVRTLSAIASEDNITGWATKKSLKSQLIEQCVVDGLKDKVSEIVDLLEKKSKPFFTAKAILKEIDSYAILTEVFREVIDYCDEQNIFLLSMASPLLSKIIDQDDAPFIYEKTGQFLNHFMIDEFQDTSNVQWQNFYPLLHNSLAENNRSLVVGDVKQSIYRFRNSDWSLLDYKLKQQFAGFKIEEKNLPDNWRSLGNVVEFNNWLYESSATVMTNYLDDFFPDGVIDKTERETFERIYSNVKQGIPLSNKQGIGKVAVNFCSKKSKQDIEEGESEYSEFLNSMLNSIFELNSKGYKPGDIAILVRTNREGARIADFLMEQSRLQPDKKEQLSFVTSESVFLNASGLINAVVAALQLLQNPNDILFRASVLYLSKKIQGNNKLTLNYLSECDIKDWENYVKQLPLKLSCEFEKLRIIPFLDRVYRLVNIFSEVIPNIEIERAFIDTFLDQILVLVNNYKADTASFMQWWSDGGSGYPVQISDSTESMRILTIHKSKGLEYDAVLIPFATWDLNPKSTTLWCEPKEAPFSNIPLVPVSYVKDLEYSFFAEYYFRELLLGNVDNLNILYVATTRAKKALYINAQMPPSNGKISHVGALIYNIVTNANAKSKLEALASTVWNEEDGKFEVGSLEDQVCNEDLDTGLVIGNYSKNQYSDILKVRLHSLEYFDSPGENEYLKQGKLFHRVLEQISYIKDIDYVIDKLVVEGVVINKEAKDVKDKIHKAILETGVEEWFSEVVEVYNEQSIILPDGNIKRPDRVICKEGKYIVVDYKFTKEKEKKHIKQVQEYVNALRNMNCENVEGFVWYVLDHSLVNVGV